MKKKIGLIAWIIVLIAALVGLGFYVFNYIRMNNEGNVHPEVTFTLTSGDQVGNVKMELYPEFAPNTVTNFIRLVEKGFYNDKVLYGKDEICLYLGRNSDGEAVNPKVSNIDDTVEKDSEADFEYTIEGEFYNNGYEKNTLSHEKGIVSLLRNDYTQYIQSLSTESYNSGNAQIAVMMSDNSSTLNGVYAAFGRVTEGMDFLENLYNNLEVKNLDATGSEVTDETAAEDTSGIDQFNVYPTITSATVDTHGVNFGMPEYEKAFDYTTYMNNYFSSRYGG